MRCCSWCVTVDHDGGGLLFNSGGTERVCSDRVFDSFRTFDYGVVVTLADSLFEGNVAGCDTCAGGAFSVMNGGYFVVHNTTIVGNAAGQFGGGVSLGDLSSLNPCGMQVCAGSVIANNSAPHGGAQVYHGCLGNLTVDDSTMQLTNGATQVVWALRRVALAIVLLSVCSPMVCPLCCFEGGDDDGCQCVHGVGIVRVPYWLGILRPVRWTVRRQRDFGSRPCLRRHFAVAAWLPVCIVWVWRVLAAEWQQQWAAQKPQQLYVPHMYVEQHESACQEYLNVCMML